MRILPLLLSFLAAGLLVGVLTGCTGGDGEPGKQPADPETSRQQPKQAEPAEERQQAATSEKKKQASPDTAAGDETTASEKENGGKKADAVNVTPIDRKGLQKAIREHRGAVVLVDFWATWCPPCIKAFPHIVDLHREYDDLQVVSVSMDDPEDAMGDVRKFLGKHDPPFETYILDVPEYTPFVRAMSDEWQGELPAMFIYGRDGERRHQLLGDHSIEEIRSRIEPLLNESPEGDGG